MFKIIPVTESNVEYAEKLLKNGIIVSGRFIENIEHKTFGSIEEATTFIRGLENNLHNKMVNYVIFKKEV